MLAMRIVEIAFPVFSIVAVGFFYGLKFKPEMRHANSLNLDVFIPALLFSALVSQPFELVEYRALAMGAVAIIFASGLLALLVARFVGMDRRAFSMAMMFCNSGNLGIPVTTLAFGPEAMAPVLVVFLVSNTLHFSLGTYLMDHQSSPWTVLKSPVLLSAIAAIVCNFGEIKVPELVLSPLEMMGQISIPLMLFSLGTRLAGADLSQWRVGLSGALFAPISGLLLYFLITPFLTLDDVQSGTLFLFAILPPAVLNYLFAERYARDPEKMAAIVVLSNATAVISVPLALAYALTAFSGQ